MSKHTPGPWTLELVQKWPFGVRVTAGEEIILYASAYCHSTVQKSRKDCEDGKGFTDSNPHSDFSAEKARRAIATQDANARLIAAAPDLLAALNAILEAEDEFVEETGVQLFDGVTIALRAGRAAIAKAEGKS